MLIWNRQQLRALQANDAQCKRLFGHYGTGKTLLLAYEAKQKAEHGNAVYFLSMLGSHEKVIGEGSQTLVFEEKVQRRMKGEEKGIICPPPPKPDLGGSNSPPPGIIIRAIFYVKIFK